MDIENLISVPQTTGTELANALRTHIEHYPIEIFEERKIEKVELQGRKKSISVIGGEVFTAPAVIISTGASWRKLNVEGEAEYIGRGVAFCPHCDGPFYQGKHVAVIGGGNSGIEAAIDLAGICKKVTIFEFADTLKADLKTKKAELKSIDKEIARIEAKKVKAETKAAESAKKAEDEEVLKKLLASGVREYDIIAKLK